MPHQIRLAGPWEFSVGPNDTAIRCQLPYELPPGVSAGVMSRRFHQPSNLSPETRLTLYIVTSEFPVEVRLNGSQLEFDQTAAQTVDWDGTPAIRTAVPCTARLASFNELSVPLSEAGCHQVLAASLSIEEPDDG